LSFERRLADWRPALAGLDASAMLFAAGQAVGRRGRGRLLWPALCVVLVVLAAVLGAWGLSERAERQALASRLRRPAPAADAPAATAFAAVPESSYRPSPDDYFHLRRRAEQDPNCWLPAQPQPNSMPSPPQQSTIPRAGQRDGLFDQ
jgi:hypothetical protein